MSFRFETLSGEYASLLPRVQVTRHREAAQAAARLHKDVGDYRDVAQATGVPAAFLMATNERESGGRLNTYLGNGEPLSRVTRLVPRGRGPFPSWRAGAKDALHLDHLDQVAGLPGGWSWPRALYESELWNGFGYRAHGVRSPYLVAGTNQQQRGKFTGDGHWDPSAWDTQLGTIPIMLAIIEIDPSLAFAPIVTAQAGDPPAVHNGEPNSAPHDVRWLQETLNILTHAGLRVDGSYGRNTKRAVLAFQKEHPPLVVDGLAGPKTFEAVESALHQ